VTILVPGSDRRDRGSRCSVALSARLWDTQLHRKQSQSPSTSDASSIVNDPCSMIPLGLGAIEGTIGHGLKRPECVLTHVSGLLFAPDWHGNGGVAVIRPDGSVIRIESSEMPLRPNGIALEEGGTFLLAHLGDTKGGIYRLHADGAVDRVVDRVDGEPMPPANFVVVDGQGRIWITVSTRVRPRADDYRASACSGFVAVAEPGDTNARIVADGLGYANECVVDSAGKRVFVNETFARRLTGFRLADDGSLHDRTLVATFGIGIYPDGLALDAAGGLLVTSIVSNRVLRVDPQGRATTLLDDSDDAHVAWAEAAYRADALGRPHLDTAKSRCLKNVSNLAFGGDDMRTAWLGNLLGDSLPWVRLDVPGVPMTHHDVALGPLADLGALADLPR